jgi:hypothetical protein
VLLLSAAAEVLDELLLDYQRLLVDQVEVAKEMVIWVLQEYQDKEMLVEILDLLVIVVEAAVVLAQLAILEFNTMELRVVMD